MVFNGALARWPPPQAEAPDVPDGPMARQKEFKALKGEQIPWVYEVTKSVGQSAFANFGQALKNFSQSQKGKRQGDKLGFPPFKSKRGSKNSFGLANDRFVVAGNTLKIQKRVSPINLAELLRCTGKLLGASVSYQAGHWSSAIPVEMAQPAPITFRHESVGVDLGLSV